MRYYPISKFMKTPGPWSQEEENKNFLWSPVYATPLSYLASSKLWLHNMNSCIANAPLSNLASLQCSTGHKERFVTRRTLSQFARRIIKLKNWTALWTRPTLSHFESLKIQFNLKLRSWGRVGRAVLERRVPGQLAGPTSLDWFGWAPTSLPTLSQIQSFNICRSTFPNSVKFVVWRILRLF